MAEVKVISEEDQQSMEQLLAADVAYDAGSPEISVWDKALL